MHWRRSGKRAERLEGPHLLTRGIKAGIGPTPLTSSDGVRRGARADSLTTALLPGAEVTLFQTLLSMASQATTLNPRRGGLTSLWTRGRNAVSTRCGGSTSSAWGAKGDAMWEWLIPVISSIIGGVASATSKPDAPPEPPKQRTPLTPMGQSRAPRQSQNPYAQAASSLSSAGGGIGDPGSLRLEAARRLRGAA